MTESADTNTGDAARPDDRDRFVRLVRRRLLTGAALDGFVRQAGDVDAALVELLLGAGIPRHEILFSLSEYHGCPFVEFDDWVVIASRVARHVDLNRLKRAGWAPLSWDAYGGNATVIAANPADPAVLADIEQTLGVGAVDFLVALPSDLVRIIENSQDLNPGFGPEAGRTPLAKTRTLLAERRSILACHRTALARGRTGLALLRTGVSFMAISLVLVRLFGLGWGSPAEAALLLVGLGLVVKGLRWYLPVRKEGKKPLDCSATVPTWGTTVLTPGPGDPPTFERTAPVAGAETLRVDWQNLSPVMRRRFLASDRTDMAEERTTLACLRTVMARSRTGLAFARTGIAFIGFGVGLIRFFAFGRWYLFDFGLIATGIVMALEGFHWYLPGRKAGIRSFEAVHTSMSRINIWDRMFPATHKCTEPYCSHTGRPPLDQSYEPGIWGTTGLALERTVLADRRNIMARIRTVMARSRTGMALIRTGMSISAVGMGLLVYFGTSNLFWTVFEAGLVILGLGLIVDGLHWHIPAERTRRQYPYCFGDFEILIPNYGRPPRSWSRVSFGDDYA